MRTTVTGAAGYLGALAVQCLLRAGFPVTAVDSLIHGQGGVFESLGEHGAQLVEGDIRDHDVRVRALDGAEAVVHLAAIVGDPACARDPQTAHAVNVDATLALLEDARRADVDRLIFASTCSNYGRLPDPSQKVDEAAELRPVSLYARQKVQVEQTLLENGAFADLHPTCLRFATLYGAGPRMRFDLTVNEFTRDLWSGRPLEVFGEQFWRPYVHVAEAAHAIRMMLEAPRDRVARQVFNVGRSDENYRKADLVKMITAQVGEREITWVDRDEDPRDYRVSFEKVRSVLGFEPQRTVPDGIAEIIALLEARGFGDPYDARYSNV
jgi:nucleoside-diphosphate-sugar epimerase